MQKTTGHTASRLNEKRARGLVCLFFALLLAVGFFTCPQYGVPWDELDEMDILRMNLWEYTIAFGGDDARFDDMAQGTKGNAPASLLKTMTPISQSLERDHGESAYYPLAWLVMSDASLPVQSLVWHLYTWLWFWLGSVALYQVCRHLGLPRGSACVAALMLMLSPRFFAEGHYNNKDIVLMSLVLLTLWQALRLIKRPGAGAALWFALFGAMAANTKLVGLAVFGLCGLGVLCELFLEKRLTKRALRIGLFSLGAFGLCYALLTPALWKDPAGFLSFTFTNAMGFSRWEGYVLFRGAVFDTSVQPLPWYYLPYMIFATTPLWALLLFCLGQVLALFHVLRRKNGAVPKAALVLCTLLWALPLMMALVGRTVVYNGWRHFYFLYGPMLALATYGLHWFWNQVGRSKGRRRLMAVLMTLCMGLTGAQMAMNHPYQYVYYNSMVALADVNATMERDYWNVSVANALKALAQTNAVQSAQKPAVVDGADLWARHGIEHALAASEGTEKLQMVELTSSTRADYVLVNHTYQHFSGWKPADGAVPVAQIIAYGQPLVSIYQYPASGGETP